MYRIAAVIVTYNRRDKLLRCLEAVVRQTADVQLDVFVADNNSSDGTEEAVREYIAAMEGNSDDGGDASDGSSVSKRSCRSIHYCNLRHNSGGAGGFCWGVRKAAESGCSHVWLMDDDCLPREDSLEAFLEFDRNADGEYGFLSSKVLWRDGNLCKMNVQRETVFRNLSVMPDGPARVEMASFVSLFVPVSVVAEAGLPIRQLFIWSDDWEYTRRISLKYQCWLIPASTVVHDCETNTGADIAAATDDRVDRFRYLYRNDVYLYRREGIRGFMYETARLALHAARIAVSKNSMSEKLRRTGIMLRGTAEGIRFFPEPDRAYVLRDGR